MFETGDPKGIRTPVTTVKGSCPRPLDDRASLETILHQVALGQEILAEWTGLEAATPGVTGRYSNQLNYHSTWSATSNLRSKRCLQLVPAIAGDPTGIRTPVTTVKGSCPRPLDDRVRSVFSLPRVAGNRRNGWWR